MKIRTRIVAPIVFTALLTTQMNVALAKDDINVYLKGKLQSFEQSPIIQDGSTLVPMRAIFEALGATIEWDGAQQIIDATKDGKNIRLKIGWKGAWIGETQAALDVAPEIINGSTMVPLRFIGEALGERIEWDGDTNSVLISTDKSKLPKVDSGTYSGYADTVKQLISANTATGLLMNDSSYAVLTNNGDAFFSNSRDKFSLLEKSKIVGTSELSKNPIKYSSTIAEINRIRLFDVKEINLDNGQVITQAFGESENGGLYFQVFYLGSTKFSKNDIIEMIGLPVGESQTQIVNGLGAQFNAPVTVIVAGNFFVALDKYLLGLKAIEEQRNTEAAQEQATFKPAQDLQDAAETGNVAQIKAMIQQGVDPNVELKGGHRPLQYAAAYGQVEAIKTLLEAGADPNLKDANPLFDAIQNGYLEAVVALLQGKANPNVSVGFYNDTPLGDAVKNADIPIIKALLNAGADPNLNGKATTEYAKEKSSPPNYATDEEKKKASTYKEIYELLQKAAIK